MQSIPAETSDYRVAPSGTGQADPESGVIYQWATITAALLLVASVAVIW